MKERILKKETILVAAHGRHAQLQQDSGRAGRVQRSVEAVAEVDHLADAAAADILQDGLQGPAVAMDIGQDGHGRGGHGIAPFQPLAPEPMA